MNASESQIALPWDYDSSVELVKQLVYRWRNLTDELIAELRTARGELSRAGRPWGNRTWAGYCEDIGVPKRTANEWLLRLTEQNRPVEALPHVAQASGENEWYTPPEYIEAAQNVMGGIDLDPASTAEANEVVGAARFYTSQDNGLEQPWAKRVWMNPPYASELIGKFAEKLAAGYEAGEVEEAIVLVNNATETEWFGRIAELASAICFPKGRIRFWQTEGEVGAPLQGQALIYLGNHVERFAHGFGDFGIVLYAER